MALTNIGQQKTPGRPTEITFAGQTGLPSDAQELLLVGHAASGATGINTVVVLTNVSSVAAASGEVATKFGDGSELAKMVLAAVRANEVIGSSTFPAIKAVPLASTDTSVASPAQDAVKAVKAEFLVSSYDFQTAATERGIFKDMATAMSGAQRVDNNQFGTMAVGANQTILDRATLVQIDTQYMVPVSYYNPSPTYSVGELAAAAAAILASNGVPFNPVNDLTVGGVPQSSVRTTVGAGLQSEAALQRGWAPLYGKPNGEVAFVRSVTSRLTVDGAGVTPVTAYYDVQDFQVLYFFRKTVWTRWSQPDFKRTKASVDVGKSLLSEVIRLAQQFEDQGMFQAVNELAKQFKVQRNASSRDRFDVYVPVNVIPGLQVIATNIQATTQFDVFTI